jgi:hypothetical protein
LELDEGKSASSQLRTSHLVALYGCPRKDTVWKDEFALPKCSRWEKISLHGLILNQANAVGLWNSHLVGLAHMKLGPAVSSCDDCAQVKADHHRRILRKISTCEQWSDDLVYPLCWEDGASCPWAPHNRSLQPVLLGHCVFDIQTFSAYASVFLATRQLHIDPDHRSQDRNHTWSSLARVHDKEANGTTKNAWD